MLRVASSILLIAAIIAAQSHNSPGAKEAIQPLDKLIVHEWGTFTALQDELGNAIGGINVDDEPVPSFVHQANPDVLGFQHGAQAVLLSKGLPQRYPYVTMRLETPVMYFYPTKSQTQPLRLDVEVKFNGGWLTQFYPAAAAETPELNAFVVTSPTSETVSRLSWKNLQVGTHADGPQTDEPVWRTPRNVQAADVTMPNGESERYLFYRGLGNIDAPLAVQESTQQESNSFTLRPRFGGVLKHGRSETIRRLWLVHIRADGKTAFRAIEPIRVTADPQQTATTVPFDFADYSAENLDQLWRDMHAALVEAGLFDDEAAAMLQTWQKSYFASGGLRLFFIVPPGWTDHYLPLSISQPAEVTRVMMGRIELISPQQRALLQKLAASAISSTAWIYQIPTPHSAAAQRFFAGHSDFGDLGVPIPPDYQIYLDLGRFRNALVLYEQARSGTPSLEKFIDNYQLHLFRVSDNTQP